MANNDDFLDKLSGIQPEEVKQGSVSQDNFLDKMSGIEPAVSQPTAQEQGMFSKMGSDISKRYTQAMSPRGTTTGIQSLDVASQAAGAVGDIGMRIAGGIIGTGVEAITNESDRKLIQNEILNSSIGKAGLHAMELGAKEYKAFAEKHPNIAVALESAFNVGSLTGTGFGAKGVKSGAEATGRLAKSGAEKVAETEAFKVAKDIAKVETKAIEVQQQTKNIVQSGLEKMGIKPTGKVSKDSVDQFYDKMHEGISSVAKRSETKISQADDVFKASVDASDEAMKSVFKEYDNIAKQLGSKGISTQPEINALKKFMATDDYAYMLENHPEAAAKLTKEIERLSKQGTQTASRMQSDISNLNHDIYTNAKTQSIKDTNVAKVLNQIAIARRANLEAALEGQGYQALKKEYGAIKDFHTQIAGKALKEAGKSNLSYLDVLSGAGAVHGLLYARPELVTSALLVEGAKFAVHRWNDPSKILKGVFRDVEKAQTGGYKMQSKAGKSIEAMGEGLDFGKTKGYAPPPVYSHRGFTLKGEPYDSRLAGDIIDVPFTSRSYPARQIEQPRRMIELKRPAIE